jgi:hypothetical protein
MNMKMRTSTSTKMNRDNKIDLNEHNNTLKKAGKNYNKGITFYKLMAENGFIKESMNFGDNQRKTHSK